MRPERKNTRLGNPKRVFGNDVSMRLADLANLDVLLIFVHLGKIAQTGALHHVGASGHREAQGVLDALGSIVPHGQEGGKRGVARADRRQQLDLKGAIGKPDVLAVGEVRAVATKGQQNVLGALGVELGHRALDGLVVATAHLNAKDVE